MTKLTKILKKLMLNAMRLVLPAYMWDCVSRVFLGIYLKKIVRGGQKWMHNDFAELFIM